MAKNKKKLTRKQYLKAIFQVAKITFKAAPSMVIVQAAGAVITAILPIVTTFFAALTTTALAEAYSGDPAAGERAITFVIVTAVLGVVLAAWGTIEQYITQLMRYKVEAAITDRMYEHFLSLDFWRYDDKHTADIYDRAKQFAQFFPYVFDRLASIFTQFITLIAGLGALFLVNWILGIILLAAVIPGVILQFKLSRAQAKHWNDNVENRRARAQIEWNLFQPQYIAELRLYSLVRHLLNLRMNLRDKDEKARIEFERKIIIKRLGTDALEAGAETTALIITALQIIAHAQPIGYFLYVQQVVSRAIGGANSFVRQLSSIDEDIANLFDYQEFMALPTHAAGKMHLRGVPEEIAISNVSFHYPHAKASVLKNVTMTIKRHQHVAIVGENGAGKSTLIKILTGLYKPTEGKILLDGADLNSISIEAWHRKLGVLKQDYLAYSFATAKDNIYFGDVTDPLDPERLEQAIKRAEAKTFLEKLPKKLDSYVHPWMEDDEGNPGTDLSGGQWQRLALARNFYRNSPIIILDEPTSAIDALAEERIFRHIFADKKRTVVTISHRLTTIEKADIIFMLKNGELVEQGTHAELVAKKGEYYTMFKSQLHENKKSA